MLGFLVLGVILCCGSYASEGRKRPNIIIILADDLGYGDFSCYGADLVKTPNVDALRKNGMKFTDAHTSSAVCTPSRYSLLTGRYNWRSWLKNWVVSPDMPLLIDSAMTTLPSMLQSKGYKTGCIGKWHLGWGDSLYPDYDNGPSLGQMMLVLIISMACLSVTTAQIGCKYIWKITKW